MSKYGFLKLGAIYCLLLSIIESPTNTISSGTSPATIIPEPKINTTSINKIFFIKFLPFYILNYKLL